MMRAFTSSRNAVVLESVQCSETLVLVLLTCCPPAPPARLVVNHISHPGMVIEFVMGSGSMSLAVVGCGARTSRGPVVLVRALVVLWGTLCQLGI